jgi:putative transposase
MPKPFAANVVVSTRQHQALSRLAGSTTCGAAVVQRAALISMAADGRTTLSISKELGVNRQRVRRWRNRWSEELQARLDSVEAVANDAVLAVAIEEALSDRHRSGTPPKFTAEQEDRVRAMACRLPSEFGLPHSQWTQPLLARMAVEQGIVESVSVAEIGRWLKKGASNRTDAGTG